MTLEGVMPVQDSLEGRLHLPAVAGTVHSRPLVLLPANLVSEAPGCCCSDAADKGPGQHQYPGGSGGRGCHTRGWAAVQESLRLLCVPAQDPRGRRSCRQRS